MGNREVHIAARRGLDDLTLDEHAPVRGERGSLETEALGDGARGGGAVVARHRQQVLHGTPRQVGQGRLQHRRLKIPERCRDARLGVGQVDDQRALGMRLARAPHVVADQLDKVGVPSCLVRGKGEGVVVDDKPRLLDGGAQGAGNLVDGDGAQLLGLCPPQERERLAVDEVEHACGNAREDERYVLPLPDEVLHCRGDGADVPLIGVLNLVDRHEQALVLAREPGGRVPKGLAQRRLAPVSLHADAGLGDDRVDLRRELALGAVGRQGVNKLLAKPLARRLVKHAPSLTSGDVAQLGKQHGLARAPGARDAHEARRRAHPLRQTLGEILNHAVAADEDRRLGACRRFKRVDELGCLHGRLRERLRR